jgi:TetR/AcrR family transcriptional regulator, cholesterol catabolism regulator
MKEMTQEKEKIRNVAATLFGERGYTATSIRDIAKELNSSVAMIYYHYKNKEELLYSIIDRIGNELLDNQARALKENIDPIAQLRDMLLFQIRNIPTRYNDLKVFVEEQINLSKKHKNIIYKQQRKIYEVYLQQFMKLNKHKQIQSNELPVLTFGLLGMVNWTYRWYRNEDKITIDRIAQIIIDAFLLGILSDTGRVRHKELPGVKKVN